MDRSTCLTCKGVGSSSLSTNSNCVSPKKKRKVLYNLGNNDFTGSSDEVADAIIKKHFPKIDKLTALRSEEFKPGLFGVCKIPEVNLSSIPKVVEPELLNDQVDKKGAPKNLEKMKEGVKKEKPETAVFDGIDRYFSDANEDVFIAYNQDLMHKDKQVFSEKDAIVVNLTKGYILVIEAKYKLESKNKRSSIKKGIYQLEDAAKILRQIVPILKQKWTLLQVLYGTTIDSYDNICDVCRKFVITSDQGPFEESLNELIENQSLGAKDFSYVEDFYNIVKAIIPSKLRIAGNLSNFMEISMNKKILQQISENVDEAGTPENIAFWSLDQFNIASKCLDHKRVLFVPQHSGFSTGKSLLMVYCAKQLVKTSQKPILFISANSEYNAVRNHEYTLQYYRLREIFKEDENVKVMAYCIDDIYDGISCKEFEEDLRGVYKDHHVFIDELHMEINREDNFFKILINWSKLINPENHFWVVSYDIHEFDEDQLKEYFPIMPKLNYPLRNTKEIIEFVQSKLNQGFNYSHCDSDGKRQSMEILKVPSNLTRSYKPKELDAHNFRNGFFKALQCLELFGANEDSVLFILTDCRLKIPQLMCEECYHKDEVTIGGAWQYKCHIDCIYEIMQRNQKLIQHVRCRQPIGENVNVELESDFTTNSWIQNNPKIDVLTRVDMIDGFSHDVVVVFKTDDPKEFEYNACMRSKAVLIVINIPNHEKFCFCGECMNCKKLTNHRCTKCTNHDSYFCSEACFDAYWTHHQEHCKESPNSIEWPQKLIKFHPGKRDQQFKKLSL